MNDDEKKVGENIDLDPECRKHLERVFDNPKEEQCPFTSTSAAPDTEPKYSKDSTPPESDPVPSKDAEPELGERSKQAGHSDSSGPAGRLPTEVKPLGETTANDEPEERRGKFRALVDRLQYGKPNPLLAKGKYRELGTFNVWQNGHIEIGPAVMRDKGVRPFKVIAVQLDRRGTMFRATAQPILKRKPRWWNDEIMGALIRDYLDEMQEVLQQLNERQWDAGVSTVTTPGVMELKRN